MSKDDDRRAIWILAFVALLGAGVRVVGGEKVAPGQIGSSTVSVDRPSIDSLSARAQRVGAPLAPGEKIDLDVAPAFEIARLPGIGTRMASRIVTIRDSTGPFGSLEAFDRVPGVGPALLGAVRGAVTFSRRPRRATVGRGAGRISLNRASLTDLATLPGIGPAKARAIVDYIEQNGPLRSPSELMRVPGIGPATLDRIIERVVIP
jgi:competence protein ComEA